MGIQARKLTEASSVIFSEIHFCMSIGKTVFRRHQTISKMPKITDDNVQTKSFSQIFTKNQTL